jgi:hypothetical protein
VNDHNLTGHNGPLNSSASANVIANWVPWITSPVSDVMWNVSSSTSYTATLSVAAMDNDTIDNTSMQFTWNFGDGSPLVVVTGSSADPSPSVTHTYSTVGTYTYVVYVSDLYVDSDGVSHNVSKTAKVSGAFTLNLIKGWNLVTVPLVGFGYKASTLGLVKNDVVASYNPTTRTYDKNFIVGVSPIPLDFAIAANTGYWIYAGLNETLYLKGALATGPQSKTITFSGAHGWAIIGFNSLNTTRKASNIPAMFSGSTISTVATYNPATKTYKSYIVGVPPTDFALSPGQAYWVYCNGNCTMTYNP